MQQRSISEKQPKYALFKFDIDKRTAIYSSEVLSGNIIEGGSCSVLFNRRVESDTVLSLSGRFFFIS